MFYLREHTMEFNLFFILNSILFGIGLAMDAFSVSVANGLNEPRITLSGVLRIAGTFGTFQTVMPLLGWLCVHTIAETFRSFQRFIPWIALALLLYLGVSMILDGIRHADADTDTDADTAAGPVAVHGWGLLLQGIATSIDALSVGFTIADYRFPFALAEAVIIGVVTFGICAAGLILGKKIGARVSGKAAILGGSILILIGLEIFVKGFRG